MPDFITLQENVLHWSVGFINFPLLVVLMDLLPILALTRTTVAAKGDSRPRSRRGPSNVVRRAEKMDELSLKKTALERRLKQVFD